MRAPFGTSRLTSVHTSRLALLIALGIDNAGSGLFLPLTLEMGSWLWVKKNPRQLFSRQGIFNPLIEHRRQRVLRRHTGWLDFVMRAAQSHRRWVPEGELRDAAHDAALSRWYRGAPA